MRRRLLRFVTAAVPILVLLLFTAANVQAQGVNTTDIHCETVNENVGYQAKTDVYLNANPSALPVGNYYVKVEAPNGQLLGLSPGATWYWDDNPANCSQLWSLVNKASDGSQGYDDTNNNGGEYKVTISPSPEFKGPDTKSDNFKVRFAACVPDGKPVITGCSGGTTDLGCNPESIPDCNSEVFASDSCGPVVVTCTSTDTNDGCNYTRTVTYTATNQVGETTCTETYTWKVDTTAPKLPTLPTGGDLGCNPTPPTCTTGLKATDNCDGEVEVICSAGEVTGDDCNKSQTFTYTATDSCGNVATKSITYTWKVDTTAPKLPELPKGGDLGCNPTPPSCVEGLMATDNCDGQVAVTCEAGNVTGDDCNKSQTFTYTATDSCGNTVSKEVTYTWKVDTEKPTIECPTIEPVIIPCDIDPCEISVDFAAKFNDNCPGATITYTVNGQPIQPGHKFPCDQTTTVTATVTDACGNQVSCSFDVTVKRGPCTCLNIVKFYDKNGNGLLDLPDEGPLGCVLFTIEYTTPDGRHEVRTGRTDVNGNLAFCIPVGSTYVITETLPQTSNPNCRWESTTGLTVVGTAELEGDVPILFGNICTCLPTNGHTPGFWSNVNARVLITGSKTGTSLTATAVGVLQPLNLRKANGSLLFGTPTYSQFRTWLLGGTATNMAYMLSVHLAASTLNKQYMGLSDATVYVLPPDLAACYGSVFANIGAVRAEAAASLSLYGSTPAGHPERARQECLKSILDASNNNLLGVPTEGNCDIVCPE